MNKLEFPASKDALYYVWLKSAISKRFWRRKILHFVNVFWLFCCYLPFEKGGVLHLSKFEFSYQRMLCTKFGWNWRSVSGEEFIKNFQCMFAILLLYVEERALRLNKLNSHYPSLFCAMFGWNWPSGSGEEDANVKSLRQQKRTTDKFQSEKLIWAFGSGELKLVHIYI